MRQTDRQTDVHENVRRLTDVVLCVTQLHYQQQHRVEVGCDVTGPRDIARQ